jgi:hypothetical protein
MDITDQIKRAVKLARADVEKEGHYPYLPPIIETLELIQQAYKNGDGPRCLKLASGLGRLTTEDYNFMLSELGGLLSDTVTDLCRRFEA